MTIASASPNSYAAESSTLGSAQTPVRGPSGRNARSPTAIAIRYDGIGCGIANRKTPSRASSGFTCESAAITAVIPFGTRTIAE